MTTPYHHIDLRSRLIEVSLALLASAGMDSLSVREVARRAGVSHNAAYRHFANRQHLLATLTAFSLTQLSAYIRQYTGPFSGAPRTKLFAGARVFVQYILDHPNHLQLYTIVFSPDNHQPVRTAASSLLDLFSETIIDGQKRGVFVPSDPQQISLTLCSLLLGLSIMLFSLPPDTPLLAQNSIDELVSHTVDLLFTGIEQQPT